MNCNTLHRLISISATLGIAGIAGAALPFGSATYPTGQRPSTAAIADLNGDGLGDLAVTTDTPDGVGILFNTGGGVLGAPAGFLTGAGTGPDGVSAADIDGDGDMDLLVILQNINTARVYLNNGAGVFVAGASAAVGENARGLATGDIDGDGDMDFAVANRDDNTVTVIMNNAGTIASSSFASGLEPRAVALGHFDADATLDLVVSNHDDRTISVFPGIGGGAFGIPATYSTGPFVRPSSVAVGDVDGDGDIDIAVATSDDTFGLDFVSIFTNTGGVFSGSANIDTLGVNPDSLVIADLSADGVMDIAVINQDSNNVSLIEGTGGGAFAVPTLIATGSRPSSIAAGDLNGDAQIDLAIPNRDSNTTTVLINGTEPPVCTADFDGNGVHEVPDVFAFLAAWFAGDASADIDGVPGVAVPDIFTFLSIWFAGC